MTDRPRPLVVVSGVDRHAVLATGRTGVVELAPGAPAEHTRGDQA